MSIRTCVLALLLVAGSAGTGLAQPFGPQPGRGPVGPQANRNQQADADAAAAAVGGMMCVIGVAAVIGIGIKIAIILFIVSDARKRGMDPTLYVVLEIFLGLIGLIIYLCSREPLLADRRPYARHYDGDEDDDDRVRRSRRYRGRDEDDEDRDRKRDWDY